MEIFLILLILLSIFYIFKIQNDLKKRKVEVEKYKTIERTFEETTFIELEKQIEDKREELSNLNNKTQDIISEHQKLYNRKERELIKFEKREKKFQENIEILVEDKKLKEKQIGNLKAEIDILKEDIELQEYGVYKPQFAFSTSLMYKEKLKDIRNIQKRMIKEKTAVIYAENWTVDGSKTKGKKMMNNNIKQILRSFNNECDVLIGKVTYKNIESINKRMKKIYEQLNKLNETQMLSLTPAYQELKFNELHLAFEYARKKEEEKETLRQQKEKEREEKILQREINEKKRTVEKDIKHYKNLIDILDEKSNGDISEEEKKSIEKEIMDIRDNIYKKEKEKEELDYREAHSSAGYVYIISNIGAFGEGVVKIGVTRRLDPEERIKELSSASVPFTYDVHALIFSYEAYNLETELHQYFDKYRVNKVNNRKEFFKLSIDEIENKLKEYGDLTIDFKRTVDAEEYRESLVLEKQLFG